MADAAVPIKLWDPRMQINGMELEDTRDRFDAGLKSRTSHFRGPRKLVVRSLQGRVSHSKVINTGGTRGGYIVHDTCVLPSFDASQKSQKHQGTC